MILSSISWPIARSSCFKSILKVQAEHFSLRLEPCSRPSLQSELAALFKKNHSQIRLTS